MSKEVKKEKYNGWAKKLYYILLVIVFLEIGYIVIARVEHSRPRLSVCSQAFNCKVDKKNPKMMNCDYIDDDGEIVKVICPNLEEENVNE